MKFIRVRSPLFKIRVRSPDVVFHLPSGVLARRGVNQWDGVVVAHMRRPESALWSIAWTGSLQVSDLPARSHAV